MPASFYEKYSHYQYLRYHILVVGDKYRIILQGWNGKRWVRARSRPVDKEEKEESDEGRPVVCRE